MAQRYSLRSGSKIAEETDVNDSSDINGHVADDKLDESFTKETLSPPPTPEPNAYIDIIERMVEAVGERIREDIGVIFDGLKLDILSEVKKNNSQMAELEGEVQFLRDSMASSNAASSSKISALEAQVRDLTTTIESIKAASLDPTTHANALPTIDNVIAGDSIVKHVDVSGLEGKSELICLPGARPRQVENAVRKLAKTANIKNLVLHYGTNSISSLPPLDICKEIEESVRRTQLELPNTSIHLSALLPKIDSTYNRTINFINNYICDMTNDMDFGFVQHSSFAFQGHLSKRMYSPSEWKDQMPIHPSHEGARLMSTNFKLHLCKSVVS